MDILVTVPGGTPLDGAVAELWVRPDGTMAADIRIPAHQD